jgi:hypothetical protein
MVLKLKKKRKMFKNYKNYTSLKYQRLTIPQGEISGTAKIIAHKYNILAQRVVASKKRYPNTLI